MPRTLVIVDMQPDGFPSADDDVTVANVIKEIDRAKKRRAGIIVCDYKTYGPTDKRIIEAIGDYLRYAHCWKNKDDGSKEIYKKALAEDFDTSSWRICGVNIAYCINRTVKGLRTIVPYANIQVKKDACNCLMHEDRSWQAFTRCNGLAVKLH